MSAVGGRCGSVVAQRPNWAPATGLRAFGAVTALTAPTGRNVPAPHRRPATAIDGRATTRIRYSRIQGSPSVPDPGRRLAGLRLQSVHCRNCIPSDAAAPRAGTLSKQHSADGVMDVLANVEEFPTNPYVLSTGTLGFFPKISPTCNRDLFRSACARSLGTPAIARRAISRWRCACSSVQSLPHTSRSRPASSSVDSAAKRGALSLDCCAMCQANAEKGKPARAERADKGNGDVRGHISKESLLRDLRVREFRASRLSSPDDQLRLRSVTGSSCPRFRTGR